MIKLGVLFAAVVIIFSISQVLYLRKLIVRLRIITTSESGVQLVQKADPYGTCQLLPEK